MAGLNPIVQAQPTAGDAGRTRHEWQPTALADLSTDGGDTLRNGQQTPIRRSGSG